jgi:hypothetical protein
MDFLTTTATNSVCVHAHDANVRIVQQQHVDKTVYFEVHVGTHCILFFTAKRLIALRDAINASLIDLVEENLNVAGS